MTRLAVGCFALAYVLVAEFSVVLGLRGLTLTEYFASRDPVAGAVYLLMLTVFAVMPMVVDRIAPPRESTHGQKMGRGRPGRTRDAPHRR